MSGRLTAPFWFLWSASLISGAGDGMRQVALPLLTAALTDDPRVVALVAASGYLPMLLGIPIGVLADRFDAKTLLVVCNVSRGVLATLVTMAVLTDNVSVALLVGFTALLAAHQVVYEQGVHRLLPAIVPRDLLVTGNSWLSFNDTVMRLLLGPPLGGVLFAVAMALPFGIDAVSFGLAAALLLVPVLNHGRKPFVGRPVSVGPDGRRPKFRTQLTSGLRVVKRVPLLRTQLIVMAAWNLTLGGIFGVLVLWARALGLGPIGYGMLALSSAMGGLGGALAASYLRTRLGPGRCVQLSLVGLMLTFAAIAMSTNALLAGAMFVLNSTCTVLWNVVTVSVRQSVVPPDLLGRVQGVYQTLGRGPMCIGAVLGGYLVTWFGLRSPFMFAAMAFVLLLPLLPALSDKRISQDGERLRMEVGLV